MIEKDGSLVTDYVNTVELFNGQTMTVKVNDDEGQIYKGNKETELVEQQLNSDQWKQS